ncbi:MAG TPA: alpha/beta fold hydrolase [Gemmatimonadaceae bacterium]|nr:alpha/beta fold hydrolase [Gemmatimonadaceae bacterium]
MTESVDRLSIRLRDGAELYYEVHGAGEPLLLLHGGGGAGVNWKLVFDFDAPPVDYRLVVPDLRGHGRSTNPSGLVTFRQLADDVIALLDHLAIEQAYMIGLSMGAKTLLHVATRSPHRVRRMVLVSAAPYFPEKTRAAMRRAAQAPKTDHDWELMRRWHSRGDDQINALWSMAAAFANDYEDLNFTLSRLGTITAPTLIVHGDRDWLYPTSLAIELHTGIANSQLWIVPNGGHGPIFGEMAPQFAETALQFLSGTRTQQVEL